MSRDNSPLSPRDRSKEVIDWDLDTKKRVEGTKPDARYGAVSESLRHAIPDTTTCSLFCGGRKCKYDNPAYWKPEQMTITGLYSSWVTDNILATSRPNLEIIEKYNIFKQFNDAGIKSIINLQTPGEHASCGPPQHASGFSYNPQDFMDNDVFFYNFGWPDYNVGSLANILDMVKVMQFTLSEGKVAVHCHAGLGRTGVLIACYLIFANRMDYSETIHYIRSKRPGAIQTRSQLNCIQEFAKYLVPLRVVFSSADSASYDFTLGQYLIRQKHMLHGYEARTLKHIPKIIFVVCERLLELAKKGHHSSERKESIDVLRETAPGAFNNRYSSRESSSSMHPSYSSPNIENLNVNGKVNSDNAALLDMSTPNTGNIPRLKRGKKHLSSSGASGSDSDSRSGSSVERGSTSSHVSVDPAGDVVAMAMGETSYSDDVKATVEEYKKRLNEDSSCWRALRKEKDPLVLGTLMWDWLDHLKEPVISVQDLPDMLNVAEDPYAGLNSLEKGAKHTTEYIFKTLAQLGSLSEKSEVSVIQRALSTLTHQNMVTDFDLTASAEILSMRRTANEQEMSSNVAMRMMYFFVRLFELEQRQIQKGKHSKSTVGNSIS